MRAATSKPADIAARIRRDDEGAMTGTLCPDCRVRYLPRFGACACQPKRCGGPGDRAPKVQQ